MTQRTYPVLGPIAVGALAIVAALIVFTGAALAAGTVSLDSPSVEAGGTARVTLTAAAPNGSGIGNWGFDINYNPSDYVGDPTCQALASGGLCAVKPLGAAGKIRFAGATGSSTGLTGKVTIGTITFSSNLAPGTCSDLTITISSFQNENGVDFPSPTVTNGEICAPAATPAPTLIWGDVDCGGSVAPRDGQAILNHFLGKTDLSQNQPCPAVGATLTIDGVPYIWGDADCNGSVAPRDGQAILNRFLGKMELSQTQPCPALGTAVTLH